ncbi:MAG: Rrf2 family transcriptional regulator [Pirellulales bacterium]|nr:Rrf2 family transcriptional regulator [Pirellulales bacterium]
MKLTRSVSYAVGILLRVLREGSQGPMTAAQIAKGCKFPPRFLYRVLRRLVDAQLMHGVSGPGGGYALARPASKITLYDIVVAVEGTPETTKLAPVHKSQAKAIDLINQLTDRGATRFHQEMKRVTLAKMAKL